MDLASLQTTVARISARLNENLSETARDLGLQGLDPASLAGVGAAGRYLEDGTVVSQDGIRETKKLLESRREASMAEGLRRVLAVSDKATHRWMLAVTADMARPCTDDAAGTSSRHLLSSSRSMPLIFDLFEYYILRICYPDPIARLSLHPQTSSFRTGSRTSCCEYVPERLARPESCHKSTRYTDSRWNGIGLHCHACTHVSQDSFS